MIEYDLINSMYCNCRYNLSLLFISCYHIVFIYFASFRSFHITANESYDTREIVEMSGLSVKDIKFGWKFIAILTEGKK